MTDTTASAVQTAETEIKKPLPKWARITLKVLGITGAVLGLAFLCGMFLFPIWWMVISSFKTHDTILEDISSFKTFLPRGDVTKWFTSYIELFSSFDNFGRAVLNSVIYCGITVGGVLLINSFAAYALARLEFPGSKVISTIIILLIIVPVETSVVPLFIILQNLGLIHKQTVAIGYIIPNLVSPFYIFMFKQFFEGIPKDLEEAAEIDGAGKVKTYFRVILPLAKPIFATVAIFTFMGAWNEYVFAQLIFGNYDNQMPLQAFLQVVNRRNPQDLSLTMASLTMSTIPIAIVYIFCQRYIIEGVSFSGLKG